MSVYDRVLEAVEALTSQIETGSDEVVLRRVDAIAIATALERMTHYASRLACTAAPSGRRRSSPRQAR